MILNKWIIFKLISINNVSNVNLLKTLNEFQFDFNDTHKIILKLTILKRVR